MKTNAVVQSIIYDYKKGKATGVRIIDAKTKAVTEFLEPQKVQRWNNRISETEMKTPDLLEFYCRSAMIGMRLLVTFCSTQTENQEKHNAVFTGFSADLAAMRVGLSRFSCS